MSELFQILHQSQYGDRNRVSLLPQDLVMVEFPVFAIDRGKFCEGWVGVEVLSDRANVGLEQLVAFWEGQGCDLLEGKGCRGFCVGFWMEGIDEGKDLLLFVQGKLPEFVEDGLLKLDGFCHKTLTIAFPHCKLPNLDRFFLSRSLFPL